MKQPVPVTSVKRGRLVPELLLLWWFHQVKTLETPGCPVISAGYYITTSVSYCSNLCFGTHMFRRTLSCISEFFSLRLKL